MRGDVQRSAYLVRRRCGISRTRRRSTMSDYRIASSPSTTLVSFSEAVPPLEVRFDAPNVTSDGGLPWVGAADEAVGVCAALSACLGDARRAASTRHSLPELLRQRIYQIVCGYE